MDFSCSFASVQSFRHFHPLATSAYNLTHYSFAVERQLSMRLWADFSASALLFISLVISASLQGLSSDVSRIAIIDILPAKMKKRVSQ
jgi:hypothetical protein